jgi:hypothetical protein
MTSTYGVEKKHSTKDSSGLVLAVVLQPFHGDSGLPSGRPTARSQMSCVIYGLFISVCRYKNKEIPETVREKTDLRAYPNAP